MQLNSSGACPRLVELPNVEILKLSSNRINTVDDLFAGMASDKMNTKLRVLDFNGTKLSTSLKAHAFSRLVGLTLLDLSFNEFQVVEQGAFSGLVNLQKLHFCPSDRTMKSLDLAVFGNEPDLANLRLLNLYGWRDHRFDSIVSSVDPSKLFAHYRHRVVVQADSHLLQVQGGRELFDGLSKNGRIFSLFN
jgi:hypothetical protein